MAITLFFFIFGLILFGVGVWALSDAEYIGGIFVIVGLAFIVLATFFFTPTLIPNGLPATNLGGGEYKVAFVYVAGENVNVGVEKKEVETERLYFYQFPKSVFDGSINSGAKKLVVVESGKFRKLVLK